MTAPAHPLPPDRWAALLQALTDIAKAHPDAAFASSLALEDMVLTHALYTAAPDLTVFTLDTGMLHTQTLGMLDAISARYGRAVQVVRPQPEAVLQYVQTHGSHAFYESVPLRKACCGIRKVAPLRGMLAGRSAWITGQRRDQAVTREALALREDDTHFGLVKFNPLALWTLDEVWQAVHAFDIPINPLHAKGYPSIGCEPCTRAVRPGEDVRAGRWWWEQTDSRECGLHVAPATPPSSEVIAGGH